MPITYITDTDNSNRKPREHAANSTDADGQTISYIPAAASAVRDHAPTSKDTGGTPSLYTPVAPRGLVPSVAPAQNMPLVYVADTDITNLRPRDHTITTADTRGEPFTYIPSAPVVLVTNGDITTGLAAYWSADEGVGTSLGDLSGNGNTGTLINSAGWGPGIAGTALLLNSATLDYVTCGAGASMDLHNALTLSLWVNFADNASVMTAIFGDYSGTGTPLYNITANQDGAAMLRFEYWTGPGVAVTYVSGVLSLNAWHHVCATKTAGGVVNFYIDNTLSNFSTSGTPGSAVATPLNILTLGRPGGFDGQYWAGSLDNIRIYNRVLAAADIATLYNTLR